MAKTKSTPMEYVYKGMITQIAPNLLAGGTWKFYSIHTPDYAKMLELLSEYANTVESKTNPITWKQLDSGLLVSIPADVVLRELPVIQAESKMQVSDTNQLKRVYQSLVEQETKRFTEDIKTAFSFVNKGEDTLFSFGMYLDGFVGQTCVLDGVQYSLYKLDANTVFKCIYRYWWKHNKPNLCLCDSNGNVKDITPALQKYNKLLSARKTEGLSMQAMSQLQTMGERMLLPMLTALYTGEALMCTVVLRG